MQDNESSDYYYCALCPLVLHNLVVLLVFRSGVALIYPSLLVFSGGLRGVRSELLISARLDGALLFCYISFLLF
jgi:hypothetical protein